MLMAYFKPEKVTSLIEDVQPRSQGAFPSKARENVKYVRQERSSVETKDRVLKNVF